MTPTAPATEDSLTDAQIDAIVERCADELLAQYLFDDVATELAGRLRQASTAGRYAGSAPGQLGALVTEDLQSVNHDRHLRLKFHTDPIPDLSDEDAAFAHYAALARREMHGVARVERLPDNVGVVALAPMLFPAVLAGDTIAAALTMVSGTDALLLDLRELRGGDPGTVQLVCSYFVDEPTHLHTMYGRGDRELSQSWTLPYVPGTRYGPTKPVWVLTSPTTFSGGEELAYELQALGRARVVGEPTGGGAHARIGVTLHPHLELTVPVVRPKIPSTGTNWEGTGVRPDVAVPAADAFDEAYRRARESGALS